LTSFIYLFICGYMSSEQVRALRSRLGLSQQKFAALLGFTFVSVNRWENGSTRPSLTSAALLEILEGALAVRPVGEVLTELRNARGEVIEVVRRLVRLEAKRE
jgi:transcriptional regulator with XRE-family HTH domain